MDIKKIQKIYTDNGFGFIVQIINAPMKKIRGKWALNIDYNRYERAVLMALAYRSSRLTGNEIKFIRNYFELSLKDFGERFGSVSHAAVIKWEKFKDNMTNMNWACEKDIRLYIISELYPKLLVKLYAELEEIADVKVSKIKLKAQEILAA